MNANSIIGSLMGQLMATALDDATIVQLDHLLSVVHQQAWTTLLALLRPKLRPEGRYFLILDNLDYCAERDIRAVRTWLHDVYEELKSFSIRLLVTSRPSRPWVLTELSTPAYQFPVTGQSHDEDIASYVEMTIQHSIDTGALGLQDQELAVQICDYIVEGAQGMFLWAQLVIEEICRHSTDLSIVESLQNLPKSLEDMFRLIHNRACATLDTRWFDWVAVAKRPLTLDELNQALTLRHGQKRAPAMMKRSQITAAISASEGLLYLDEDDQLVHLVHHSFRQYLMRQIHAAPGSGMKSPGRITEAESADLCMMVSSRQRS